MDKKGFITRGRLRATAKLCNGKLICKNHDEDRRLRGLVKFLRKKYGQKREGPSEKPEYGIEVIVPDDLLFKILILVPAGDLVKLQFVCKKWFRLINSPLFIKCHSDQAKTILICQDMTLLKPSSSYATLLPQIELKDQPRSYFHYTDLTYDGDASFIESSVSEVVSIRATCDGLVLASTVKNTAVVLKNNGCVLYLINPITRSNFMLPPGIVDEYYEGSYGIGYCNLAKTYKVVHLFCKLRGQQLCCELLTLGINNWKSVEIFSSPELFQVIKKSPVPINGTLYWMLPGHGREYYVSFDLNEEKLITRKLPVTSSFEDRLIEIAGNLGIVHFFEDCNTFHVWILVNEGDGDGSWINHYCVQWDLSERATPICSLTRNGKEILFECGENRLIAYDFDKRKTRDVRRLTDDGEEEDESEEWNGIKTHYFPHRSTLVSW